MTISTVGRLGAALMLAFGTANAQSSVFKLDSDGKFDSERSIISAGSVIVPSLSAQTPVARVVSMFADDA